jgi:hypothetical protein
VKAEKVTKAILDVIFLDEKGDWISHKMGSLRWRPAAERPTGRSRLEGEREQGRMAFFRARVHAPVSILEVLRAAPRMIDQKPYPRLNRQTC